MTQGEINIDEFLKNGIPGGEIMEQEKHCFNSLENRFHKKEHFLEFLEFKREVHSGLLRAKLQNYQRKKDKCSREYFMESRKGATSLFHPWNKKIYIFGGLGVGPISLVEEYQPYKSKFIGFKAKPTPMITDAYRQ